MHPTKISIKNDTTYFHYNFPDLLNFVRQGKKDGNVGMLLIKRKKNTLTYKGFGTIENPFRNITTLTMQHYPPFDGEMLTDEERLLPQKSILNSNKNLRFTILKFK